MSTQRVAYWYPNSASLLTSSHSSSRPMIALAAAATSNRVAPGNRRVNTVSSFCRPLMASPHLRPGGQPIQRLRPEHRRQRLLRAFPDAVRRARRGPIAPCAFGHAIVQTQLAVERLHDVEQRDLVGRTRELEAPFETAVRHHQAGADEPLQDLSREGHGRLAL